MGNSHKVVKYDGDTNKTQQVGKASNPTRAVKRATAANATRTLGSSDRSSVQETGK